MGKHLNRNFSKDDRMATSSCKDIQYHESFKTTKSQYRALAGPCSSLAGGKAELYDRFRERFAVSRELKCTHHRILRLQSSVFKSEMETYFHTNACTVMSPSSESQWPSLRGSCPHRLQPLRGFLWRHRATLVKIIPFPGWPRPSD